MKQFKFLNARSSLDLLATLGARGTGKSVEKLETADDLAGWIRQSGILGDVCVATTEDDLKAARALRHATYAVIDARLRGEPVSRSAIQTLNAAAARVPPSPVLGTSGERLHWTAPNDTSPARSALAAVARDAVALLGGSLFDRVRRCANPACIAPFLDLSRPGTRRWCSMDDGGCGNRAKTSAFRARRKSGPL